MTGRARRGHNDPPAVRAVHDREAHLAQLGAYGFLAPRRARRSVTVIPRSLRYWQYHLVRWPVVLLVALALTAWLGFLAWRDGGAAARDEAPFALLLGLLVLVLSTGRFTVSDTALSTDIAGLRRVSSFGIVTLGLVEDVVAGPAPAVWPRARRRGGWWPGRTRVAVRHLAFDGETPRAFTVWVRDPEAFAEALGRPLR